MTIPQNVLKRYNKWLLIPLFVVLSLVGYGWIGYEIERTQTAALILNFAMLFIMYSLIISQKWDDTWVKRWLWVAVGFRLVFLLSIPILSDDYFRFIWDGRLLAAGYNPYLYLPTDLIHSSVATGIHLDETLFNGLNSPNYFTVYPPLNQLMFGLSAWISGNNILLNVSLLRTFIILSEIGIIWLMWKLSKSHPTMHHAKKDKPIGVLVYALNPLVIVELTGNLHFEAVTLFFILLAVWGLNKRFQHDKFGFLSAVALGLGATVKLLPLLFLPLFIKRLGYRKGVLYSTVAGGVLLLLFLPFLSQQLFFNFGKSLDLYFQKFEFNASFYYLLREVGFWLTGYNVIQTLGPLLSFVTLLVIILIAFQRGSLLEKMLLSLTIYFLLATTVHPWYITTLVALGAMTGRWYPILWSALLPLTYIAYHYQPYHENIRWVFLEYVLVISCLVYELVFRGIKQQ